MSDWRATVGCWIQQRTGWWPAFALFILVFGVWGHSITFDFVWDDQQFVIENSSIRSLKNVPAMFTDLSAQSSYPEGFKLFRPLRTVHYALLFFLGGGHEPVAWIFHLANVLWHAIACLLLYRASVLLFELAPSTPENLHWAAFLTAAGFAVHPVAAEVVCWVKSLDDIMAAAFTFAALVQLLKGRGRWRSYAASLLFYVLALYSKISALPFAFLAGLVFILMGYSWKRGLAMALPFLCAAGIFMVHRHWVIGQSSQHAPISGTYLQTLIDMFPVTPIYLRLILGIPPFCADYSYLKGGHEIVSGSVLGGGLLLLAGMIFCLRAWQTSRFRLAAWGGFWLAFFMIPVSNLLPMMQYMAERFVYLPMAGWFWLLAVAGLGLIKRQMTWICLGFVILAWAGLAWQRSFIWKDSLTLFVTSSQDFPEARRIQNNAVAAVFGLPHIREFFPMSKSGEQTFVPQAIPAEKRDAILKTLHQAQQLYPRDARIANTLGIIYAKSDQPNQAVEQFRKATEADPSVPFYWRNLVQACHDAGQTNLANSYQQKATQMVGTNWMERSSTGQRNRDR